MKKIENKFQLIIGIFFLVYSAYPLLSEVPLVPYIFFAPLGIWNIIDGLFQKKGHINQSYHPGMWIGMLLWGITIAYIYLFQPVYVKDPVFYIYIIPFVVLLGMAIYEQQRVKKYKKALKPYEKAIKANPEDTAAWNNKGATIAKFKAYHAAIQCFNKVIEINPKDAAALYNIGVILMELGNLQEALKYYNIAQDLDPGFKNAKKAGEMILEL
ncbi:tetratricopeptide repeat protein [Methanobacterium sp.]|uniref:tetratricopeptide repeat protein n=1 Tax=Methanobacterium sp. TaxID=2164 RepID=UPI003C73CF97